MATLKWLLTVIITWALEKVFSYLGAYYARMKRAEEIKKESEKSVEALKKAETAEEIDRAADDALNNF